MKDVAPGLKVKLEAGLMYLHNLPLGGRAYQGDVLFTKEDIRKQRIKGKDYLVFTPNVLMYAVAIDSESELYRKISVSEFGIVVHTVYDVKVVEDSLQLDYVKNSQAIYDLEEKGKNINGLFITHPHHKQIKLGMDEKEIENVEKLLLSLDKTKYKIPTVFTKQLFDRFVNYMIREGGEISIEGFNSWVQDDMGTEMVKRKTKRGQDAVEEKYYKVVDEINTPSFKNFMHVYGIALEIKKIFLAIFHNVHSKIGETFFQKGKEFGLKIVEFVHDLLNANTSNKPSRLDDWHTQNGFF